MAILPFSDTMFPLYVYNINFPVLFHNADIISNVILNSVMSWERMSSQKEWNYFFPNHTSSAVTEYSSTNLYF